jgi:DUF1680 family protein
LTSLNERPVSAPVRVGVDKISHVKYFLISSLLCATLFSAVPQPAVPDKIKDRFIPARYEDQEMAGFLAERMRVNLEGRLLHVDEEALLKGFEKRPGSHPWIGEHVGKYLHAAANTYRYTHDERLKKQMDRMARRLIASQSPDGYLGTYTDDQRWTSWDVWVHKYALIGLLSYYQLTGYTPALDASKKVGNLLCRTFGDGPGQRDIIAAGTHVGMAATSVLEPIVMLYRYSGDKRYLDFAQYLVHSWDQASGPKIVATLLEIGSVYKTANAKAYEMMSNLVGLVDLYRMTGEERFLKAAQIAWKDIASKRLYVTGTTSSKEHFRDDFDLPGSDVADVGEGCATVTWLQLSWQLLRLTGEQRYADELERSVYNQLLAAQDPSNGNICYFTPLVGHKNPTPGINCCVSSEPRGISMIPQLAWGALDDGIAVLFYTGGKVTVNGTTLLSETNFPDSGKVSLTVQPGTATRFPIYLRVPYWASGFTASVGNQKLEGTPGQFIKLERDWKPGEKIGIDMDLGVHIIEDAKSYPGSMAIQRGPQVLALDLDSNPDIAYLHLAAPKSTKLKQTAPRKFRIDGEMVGRDAKKKPVEMALVPFTEASTYRIWMAKPESLSTSPVSVTAFGKETWSRRGTADGSICDDRADTYRNTAKGKSSTEDWYAVELNRPDTIKRIVFRHGKSTAEGGWFDGKPGVQVKRTAASDWETVGELSTYSGSADLKDGTPFELVLDQPIKVVAVRVVGKPAKDFTSCAELAAYAR